MAKTIRYHYMDNLRAIAMLAGVFFHAALAYSPLMENLWLAADSNTSVVVDVIAWFSHLFRMPLFFLIAGFFTCYMVQKRGITGLLKNRALRILLPFVIFLPLVYVSFFTSIGWAFNNVQNLTPMLNSIAQLSNNPDATQPPLSTTHLWFLYNLVQFYLVYVVLHKTGALESRFAAIFGDTRFVVFVLPLLMIPGLLTQGVPSPAPEQFYPRLWSFGYFGLFFLVGSQLFKRQGFIDELRPYVPWLLVSSIALYVVLFSNFPTTITFEQAIASIVDGIPFSAQHLLQSTLEAVISVHMTLVCLVAGKTWLDRPSRVNRFIADSSYWVYIVHLPVLFWIQFATLDMQAGLLTKFAISSLGTLAFGMVTYVALIRWSPIGWMLNGRKRRQPVAAAESA